MTQNNKDSAIISLAEIGAENEPFMTTHNFSSTVPTLDRDDEDVEEEEDNLMADASTGLLGSGRKSSHSVWTIAYYQQFFDVDTAELVSRLLWSIAPRPKTTATFFRHTIRRKPDLYGPFWICVTLIFSVAIAGNIASFLQSESSSSWHYDFHKITAVSSAVFGYAWMMPVSVYLAILWKNSSSKGTNPEADGPLNPSDHKSLGLLDLLCAYGYSLSIFVPVSVLWLIQNSALQWSLAVAAFILSGAILFLALWQDLSYKSKKFGLVVILVVLGLHLLLSCGFMLWLFHSPASHTQNPPLTSTPLPHPGSPSPDNKMKRHQDSTIDLVAADRPARIPEPNTGPSSIDPPSSPIHPKTDSSPHPETPEKKTNPEEPKSAVSSKGP